MKKSYKSYIGKKVKILTDKREFEGRIIESYDPKIMLLKLSSGYNIGIEKTKIKKIRVLEKAKKEIFKPKIIKQKNKLPEIAIIVTGGTIASKLDYKTGGVKALTKPEEIISIAPKIQEIARITIEKPFSVMSEDMTSKEWKILAKLCEKLLNKKEIKGIIILHGTDTLHYTASALSFMLQNLNKPVVLTYAQRSIDRGSSDALLNLMCSVHAALSDIAEVMLVGHSSVNDNFCFCLKGTKTRKMHTSRRDTFRPINIKPIATINEEGKIQTYITYRKRNNSKVKAIDVFNDKIALVKFYPNSSPKVIDFYKKQNYKALIIEATGLGHVSTEGQKSWLETLKRASKAGMIICFATQCLYGALDPFVYGPGRKLKDAGVIFLKDMLPETAYIKLGWLLGKEKNKEKIKELMQKNLVGEYNTRLSIGDFLI